MLIMSVKFFAFTEYSLKKSILSVNILAKFENLKGFLKEITEKTCVFAVFSVKAFFSYGKNLHFLILSVKRIFSIFSVNRKSFEPECGLCRQFESPPI